MKQKPVLSLILLLSLALFTVACNAEASSGAESEAAAQSQAETEAVPIPVEVALVKTGDISLIYSYSGSLNPQDEIEIIPGAAGRIESVLVEEGDIVKTGDPIAIIEDDTYQAQVKQAEAAVEQARLSLAEMELGSRPEEIAAAQAAVQLAKANLNDVATIDNNERTQAAANMARAEAALKQAQTEYDKIAWAGDVGSKPQSVALQEATIAYENALANYTLDTNPSDSQLAPLMLQVAQAELNLSLTLQPFRQIDFAKAQAGVKQAEAGLEAAQIQLAETIIEAPFDGTINRLNIAKGSRVGQQTSLATFTSNQLEAEIGVQESRISQVEQGQSASLQVTAFPGQEFPGIITSISPSANTKSRTFNVKITPTEGVEMLRSGMFVDVSILAQENKNSVLAPREAIIQAEQPTVYVVNEDNSVERRNVTTGLYDDQQVEILQGLQDGDVVVIAGQSNLDDGATAEIVNDPRIAD